MKLIVALDLRTMDAEFRLGLATIVEEELHARFGRHLSALEPTSLLQKTISIIYQTLDVTTTMDTAPRMKRVVSSSSSVFLDVFATSADASALAVFPDFCDKVASRATSFIVSLREEYLGGSRGPAPASKMLKRTKPVYEFVRVALGIAMHGKENDELFAHGLGATDVTIGQNVSLIHEVCTCSSFLSNLPVDVHPSRQSWMARLKPSLPNYFVEGIAAQFTREFNHS